MNEGLGLPISDPSSLLDWARRADAGPFSTLGLLDRLVYSNPEPLVTLAAIAGATTRIRVQTEVPLAPLRIRDATTAFTDLGADEVMLYCWARDGDQIDRLADVVV